MRAIWKGSISFGLVSIPVALQNASRSEELKFRLLRRTDLSPVNYKRVAAVDGKEVAWEDIVKGYEYEKGKFIVLKDEDFKRVDLEATDTIDIVDFVDLAQINPVYFHRPYYLEPQKGGAGAYDLLRRVLADTNKAGISKVVIRTRQHLAAVKANGDLLVLELMRFADELIPPGAIKVPAEKKSGAREIGMARTLVNQMSEDWDPDRYTDDYRSALMKLIDRKVKSGGKELPGAGHAPKRATNVIDLAAVLQQSLKDASGAKPRPRRRESAGRRPSVMARARHPEVKFTNLDKVFFPKTGFTKGQMIRYYVDVAPFILPYLRQRPVTLIRYPDGVEGEKFYEKNAPRFAPAWIKTFAVNRRHQDGQTNYIVINDAATLAWCANIAGLELHPFLHRIPALDRPTQVVFDLDPGEGADLRICARVAFLVKEIADGLGLRTFPKVSGSKGLQVYLPLNTKTTYAATGSFAKAVAELLQQRFPELVVSGMAKSRRRGRVLIDWSQNNPSKTTVAVYSMRGKREQPFISMPVTWLELKRFKKPAELFFTPEQALRRLKKSGDLFAPVLTLKQKLPKAFNALRSPAEAALGKYGAKRDFSKTKEPAPTEPAPSRASGKKSSRRFVIQKHAASHLHYDFRLEMDGTLKSWAIPKGVSTEPGIKRAAFAVEDHPIGYLKFEGTIPKGQYGGGTVMVWDLGTYEVLGGSYAAGDLKLRLAGKKLRGEWHLFKIRSADGKDVWLITKAGAAARPVGPRQDDRSVLTRRSMARIAQDNDAQWQSRQR